MNRYFTILLFLLLGSCVSVNLPQGTGSRAEKLSYKAPPSPFAPVKTESADRAWQSEKTGNTLAFTSECATSSDVQLKTLESESLNALHDGKVLSSHLKSFDQREALETVAEGTVDGIAVKVALLVYQKNGCNFTLSFSGRKNNFESEKQIFEEFKESFRAPQP